MTRRGTRLRVAGYLGLAMLAGLGFAEAVAVYVWNPGPHVPQLQLAYGLATAVVIFLLGSAQPFLVGDARAPLAAPRWGTVALLAAAVLISAIVAQVALEAYPASGDEYGFNYVADTLLRGRLWNPAYPAAIRDVLATNYVGGHGDQRLSQYAPGWPVLLMPFKALGVGVYANVVVGLAAGLFLWAALRLVPVPANVRLALLALGVAAPFTLFNDASYFSHPLTAACLLAIIWLDLRDAAQPSPWNRAGIGLAFAVLLTARYEAFFLAFLLFVVDAVLRHRLRVVRWAFPAAIAAAPITILFLLYNWRITGSPFTTTLTWVTPDVGYGLYANGVTGANSPARAVRHTVEWFGRWQDFAAAILLPLYAVALWFRIATRSLRWFDLLWPTVVVFFFFFPDDGGYQFGPRYWYIAHAAMPVTIAAGLPLAGECWQIRGSRLDPLRLCGAQLASFAGFSIGFALFLHLQIENWRAPARIAATAPTPSLVLVETAGRRYGPWQGYAYQVFPKDYTRNGLDGLAGLGPTAIGLNLGTQRTALLCEQMPDRAIYLLHLDHIGAGGELIPVCHTPVTVERN